jgi:ATP-dependent DNA helicase RecQ
MTIPQHSLEQLRQVIERHWGYRSFRPQQEQAMQAALTGRDSLVVMPTGGGKSLCYQAPAMLRGGTTVVVSPLIALMKDQVDSLRTCGIPAIQIDSTMSSSEKSAYEMDLVQGGLRLLFVSPERLALSDFCRLLQKANVHSFAIDEAHCISHWGHDFRPDYRQMGRIKELFPQASLHAYTATATAQVRTDICKQLKLKDPLVLVGNFDRPNLTYRVHARNDEFRQVMEVLDRHKGEAGIVYCISRKDVDELNAALASQGIRSRAYHAGLDKDERSRTQEAFAAEKCDVIVATVAFGMGINRSNIRFVIHAAMPKSIEHYQQETGRAGRDGLEAECVLLHSGADFKSWKWILDKSVEDSIAKGVEVDPNFLRNAMKHLEDIDRYCRNFQCRHRALVQHFDQKYELESCAACDICLGDAEPVPDAQVIAQKILSCVARVEQRYGINHVICVLRGAGDGLEKVRTIGHDKLSTFGLLKEHDKNDLRDWIHQLVNQGVLIRDGDDYPVLRLNDLSWEVMKKQRTIKLLRRKSGEKAKKSLADTQSWEGVDRELFEQLRDLRKELADIEKVPPYIIFGDATLREFARSRPASLEKMRLIYGVGERKQTQYGDAFLKVIAHYCQTQGLATDVGLDLASLRAAEPKRPPPIVKPTGVRATAFEMFDKGDNPVDVAHQTNRSVRTVMEDLSEYIRWKAPKDISQWIKKEDYDLVAAAADKVGTARLKPIFEELGGKIPYEDIRLVVSHLECQKKP